MSSSCKIRQLCWIFCNSVSQCLSCHVCAFLLSLLAASLTYSWSLNARGRLREKSNSGLPLSRLEISSSQGRDTQAVVTADEKVRTVFFFTLANTLLISFTKDEIYKFSQSNLVHLISKDSRAESRRSMKMNSHADVMTPRQENMCTYQAVYDVNLFTAMYIRVVYLKSSDLACNDNMMSSFGVNLWKHTQVSNCT